jgi:hypothetical protein
LQERYLGDVHDFMKYALLRHLHRDLGLSIGVNWYLTDPLKVDGPGNNDGNQRHHLKGGVYNHIDFDLLQSLNHFNDATQRKLADFETSRILPEGTSFFGPEVPVNDRNEWHNRALEHLKNQDLVFIDPDTGFRVPSASNSKLPKYALYEEAMDYLAQDKVVMCIQFAPRCDPDQRARDIRTRFMAAVGKKADLPAIRCRVTPNILFLFLANEHRHPSLKASLESFGDVERRKVQLVA